MRIAIDTGGTFTDCIFLRGARLEIVKVFSTPQNPALAIAHALERIVGGHGKSGRAADLPQLDLICGTTVGTNALLERRGGSVALVTTAGFEDVLEIGRQARPHLYDFFVERPQTLVPAVRRFGLRERVGPAGETLLHPSPAELARVSAEVRRSRAGSVAVCLLFSFSNPRHEQAIARLLRRAGYPVSVSHEILPEYREFERTSTTVINAYLVPVMSRYLGEIERHASASAPPRRTARSRAARSRRVRIMQSSGGIISAGVAAREPVRTILSGPAGGVLGAGYVAGLAGFDRAISFDMGGTSTDVALLEGPLRTTNEASVAGLPVAVPILDIHTVGAGGGSIARFDRAGALRVGPESAGADPGPICYGRGERPTVTDAHLVLGRILAEKFLGGEFRLDAPRARAAFERARGPMRSVEAFAQGILDVANSAMERAIRVISIERGHDPRDFTLVAFGGAGPLHACELAGALRMPCVLIPKFPGALSALGILRTDVVRDFSQTVRAPVRSVVSARAQMDASFARMEHRGARELAAEGFSGAQIRVERYVDMRYVGQAYELRVPWRGDFLAGFHRAHEQRYGYADPQREAEIVNVRVRAIGLTPKPRLSRSRTRAEGRPPALGAVHRAYFRGKWRPARVCERATLRAGLRFTGPAVITEYSATTVVPPGWRVSVDEYENLILTPVR